jgi:hypothetical protein
MSEHLDLDQLADVLAGDDAARPHLADCEQCRAELVRLEQALPAVTSALAGLPLPAPPADLDDRLARALRPAPAVDLEQRRASRWVRPMAALSGIAAAAALVFGGIVVLGDDNDRSADQSTANSAESALKTSSTGSAYRKDGKLLAQQLPALLAGDAPTDPKAPVPMLATKDARAAGGAEQAADDPLAQLRTTEGLASCLTALTPPGEVVLPEAIDYATFEGNAALVVVLSTTKADRVDVFVVGPGCTAADPALLYFGRFNRP